MSIDNALNEGISTQLVGGTALISALGGTAIFYQQAPDHQRRPFVVWSFVAGGDENATSHRSKNKVMLVRSFADNPEQAGTIDALVDARLHLQAITVSGWSNFWTARETDVALVENEPSGDKVYMAGGMYRVRLEQN